MAATPLTNPHYVQVWHNACTKAVTQNPESQADLYLQLGLNELREYLDSNQTCGTSPLQIRQQIYNYFKEAGKSGHPRGLFFEGLALQGFGCQPDLITSQALIRVAAFARNCDLALQFLILRLGQSHLYHQSKPNYAAAIKCFNQAGAIANQDKLKVREHIMAMRKKLLLHTAPSELQLYDAPKIVNVARARFF